MFRLIGLLIVLLLPPGAKACSPEEGTPDETGAQDASAQTAPAQKPDPVLPIPGPGVTRPRPPMTVGEKFKYSVWRGFGPSSVLGALGTAGYQQYFNSNAGFGQGASGYFSRAGARYGRTATKHMLGSFILASVLRQDPRYGRSELESKKARLFYALSRVVITRGDSGRTQFNLSGVGGTMGAAFISSTWYKPPDNTMRRALNRGLTSLGVEGLRNIVREFWPEIRDKLKRK